MPDITVAIVDWVKKVVQHNPIATTILLCIFIYGYWTSILDFLTCRGSTDALRKRIGRRVWKFFGLGSCCGSFWGSCCKLRCCPKRIRGKNPFFVFGQSIGLEAQPVEIFNIIVGDVCGHNGYLFLSVESEGNPPVVTSMTRAEGGLAVWPDALTMHLYQNEQAVRITVKSFEVHEPSMWPKEFSLSAFVGALADEKEEKATTSTTALAEILLHGEYLLDMTSGSSGGKRYKLRDLTDEHEDALTPPWIHFDIRDSDVFLEGGGDTVPLVSVSEVDGHTLTTTACNTHEFKYKCPLHDQKGNEMAEVDSQSVAMVETLKSCADKFLCSVNTFFLLGLLIIVYLNGWLASCHGQFELIAKASQMNVTLPMEVTALAEVVAKSCTSDESVPPATGSITSTACEPSIQQVISMCQDPPQAVYGGQHLLQESLELDIELPALKCGQTACPHFARANFYNSVGWSLLLFWLLLSLCIKCSQNNGIQLIANQQFKNQIERDFRERRRPQQVGILDDLKP